MFSNTDVHLIDLPKIIDNRGNLSFLEEETHVPFKIRRTYWIYDVPGGELRGGHSYKKNRELIIALSGSFSIVINRGNDIKEYSLNRSYMGLYIPCGIWRHMENFSTNACALILSSTKYDAADYERDFDKYLETKSL